MLSLPLTGLAFASLTLSSALPPLGYERKLFHDILGKRGHNESSSCLNDAAPVTSAPKPNIWAQIPPEDNLAVWNLLHDPSSGLNLTERSTAKPSDNYVFWIDTLPLNKSDVLPFIDAAGNLPAKYARAIIFEGGKAEPDSQEYMVGPLPVSATTTIQKLDYIYNGGKGGSVPYNGRYFDSPRSTATEPLIISIMSNISDITAALFHGGVYYGSRHNRTTLTHTSGTPVSYDGTQAFRNIMFRYPGPPSYMTPLDFFLLLDCTGTDPSLYKMKGFVTGEKFYPTIAALRRAFTAGELGMEYDQTKDADWALVDYKPELGVRALEEGLAPATLEIGGKRYKIDETNQYVEYMGWSFYIALSRTLGVMFYGIKFKSERILYELSMQEATAQYGGNQPKAANTVYHDTYYSFMFWNLTYHSGNGSVINANSLCIFEADMNFPLSRHRTGASNDYGFSKLGTVKGAQLIVRAIATVGNYDYTFDYGFHMDGSLEVSVRASGYLQSRSLHDHIITFKGDFDILGTGNALQVSELKVVNQSQPWFPELGAFEQMETNVSIMQEEKQFNGAPNNQAMSDIHLSTLSSPWSLKNSEFAKSHLAVSRQHDNEVFANSVQNANLPLAPQQDFSKFFDGENIEDEDLVVWFNLGMHHFTRSEDVPVTLYTEAYSSFVFAPQNFFDRAQDGDLLNRRWMEVNAITGELTYETYGVGLETYPVQLQEPGEHIVVIVEV
ncbi:amine oxidase catalytic domain-containing protein [Setomelanomma holmii]|uniref:Amine oxidase n=1 Tax=Setomelanomma holmii TaxID=210430 RepID=A0A9P4HLD3_9PLEO|nr:amine oxidase catalytic domain-containing protein [Setomelanomma holmii]